MTRYKLIDMSPWLLPVHLDAQLVPGTFAHAVYHLIDDLDLSAFDAHYRNDVTGASAHDPAMLLRAVLLGYSQGLVSSRAIERACRENVLFIAITGDAKPHFTTIAAFIRRSREAIASRSFWPEPGRWSAPPRPCWTVTVPTTTTPRLRILAARPPGGSNG